ncbi:MAB_1171c family putative transporter [Actinoplanes sp. TFC3]|uniref:MAB_1171c family putative transporter n=1 Tax=Actinoplanes sp. TFC3 TaxID=1710355 RepID=UPI000831DE45|nr:MAB_1171c family putative transporter [Actinoplanes sp. TFC3]
MTDLGHPIAFLIGLTGLLFKLRDLRRDPGNPALRAICGVLAALTGAVLVGWEPVYVGLDRLAGIPNLAKPVEHALALTAAAAVQVLYLNLGDPHTARRRARLRWAALVAVLVIMAVAFGLGGFTTEAPDDFATRYADDPNIIWYMLVYLSYLALAMADIYRSSTRYARHATARLLRWGIWLLAIGSVIGLAYVVHKAGFIITHRFGLAPPWAEATGSRLLITSGIAFVTTGLVLPSAGAAVLELVRWPGRYRLYRQLRPLWQDITAAVPGVVLYRRQLVAGRITSALYRLVIEIHDGRLQLQAYLRPEDHTAASALDPATADACLIGIAIERQRANADVAILEPVPPKDADQSTFDPQAAAVRLARVATAYSHSPVVAEARNAVLADSRSA